MKQVRGMGPLGNLMKMIPGMGKAMQGMGQIDERELDRIEAIILSMTPYERAHPAEINGSRRKRIADRVGHDRPGRQPPRQAVRPDEQDDEADVRGQDAEPRAADEGRAVAANLTRRWFE